jgi:hypothetical protein
MNLHPRQVAEKAASRTSGLLSRQEDTLQHGVGAEMADTSTAYKVGFYGLPVANTAISKLGAASLACK